MALLLLLVLLGLVLEDSDLLALAVLDDLSLDSSTLNNGSAVFPSIRVFSNESALCIRWPKYWSFSFSISPSNEHPGLISFRMD